MSITTKRPAGARDGSRTPCTLNSILRSPATSSRVSPGDASSDAVTQIDETSIRAERSGRGMSPAVPNVVSPIRSTPNSGTVSPVFGRSAKPSMRGEKASGSGRRTRSPYTVSGMPPTCVIS